MKSSTPNKENDAPAQMPGDIVRTGNAVLDDEAIELIADIQHPLGAYYCMVLRRLSDLLIENFDAMAMEHDEAIRLLQALANFLQDISTLMRPGKEKDAYRQ